MHTCTCNFQFSILIQSNEFCYDNININYNYLPLYSCVYSCDPTYEKISNSNLLVFYLEGVLIHQTLSSSNNMHPSLTQLPLYFHSPVT